MRGHIRKKGPSWQACVKTTDPVTGRSRQLTATHPIRRLQRAVPIQVPQPGSLPEMNCDS